MEPARFRAAERMQSLLVTQHALAVQVRSFRVAMHLQLGQLESSVQRQVDVVAENAMSSTASRAWCRTRRGWLSIKKNLRRFRARRSASAGVPC